MVLHKRYLSFAIALTKSKKMGGTVVCISWVSTLTIRKSAVSYNNLISPGPDYQDLVYHLQNYWQWPNAMAQSKIKQRMFKVYVLLSCWFNGRFAFSIWFLESLTPREAGFHRDGREIFPDFQFDFCESLTPREAAFHSDGLEKISDF